MIDSLKESLFSDEKFRAYRDERDDIDVVLDLTEFKWVLTLQLRTDSRQDEDWRNRITSLIIRTKSRTAEVKRSLRAEGRGEDMDDALADLRADRAEDDGY